jgi:TRAP-type C4-dicarboxylate transport system permease small subunit
MKQFLVQHRNSVRAKALYSSATVSVFIFVIIRTFTYDFPMSWAEEIALFLKVISTGTFMISLATIGCAGLYRSFERIKRYKRPA